MQQHICYGCMKPITEYVCPHCGWSAGQNNQPHQLRTGTLLRGQFLVGRVLGQGGFGITYTAQDYQTKQLVAVKEFFPDSMATRTGRTSVIPFSGERGDNFGYGRDSFLREAQTMAEFIGNPNIVRVYSYFEENGTAYFVMEYVDGVNLYEYLRTRGGRITFDEALELLLPVMDALSAVHEKGIIHRDITPDNIYISRDGTVKLLDFGAARYSLGNVSRSLDVILKHGFAPKEQYKRRGHQGPYTDVYSLGATFYYAITGAKPDDAIERSDEDDMPFPSSLGAVITPMQEDVLLTAMAVDAENRYQTMAQFRAAAKNTVSTLIPAPEPPKPPKPPKPDNPPVEKTGNSGFMAVFNKHRKLVIGGGIALLLIITLLICYSNCTFGHTWAKATCTEPRTCTACGETEGKAAGHSFQDATCTEPKTCEVCGLTKGKALGHAYSAASCSEPRTCSRCGHSDGTSLSHDYKPATCTEPMTCKLCGATNGMANGHDYTNATCTAAKTCLICNHTSGTALGHDWKAVPGTTDEKCSRCGMKQKSETGLIETLAGHWSSTRADVGGTRTATWVFEETVTGCVEFTMHYQIVSVSKGSPFGAHKLYAKNANGKWVVLAKFDVKDKNEVVKTFRFEEPQTFTQLVVISQAAGSFSYSDDMWFENFYFE